jgi:excinuclease ABC subunit C
VYVPERPEPVRVPRDSEALYLLQQVRDEAHRFAITYHRQRRQKTMTRSVLDDVPGLGPTRRTRLLKEFGSVKKLRERSEDELVAIPWLPERVARAVYAKLHGERATMDGRRE